MRWITLAALLTALALAANSLLHAAAAHKQGSAGGGATAAGTTNAEFAAAADQVLHQMSEITGLKLLTPLKKSLRSREQIRAYVISEMKEDKDEAERYAGERSAEAFGLLPKGFDLDNFMIDLLTEQIAGLYDPKTHEFYVADWIPASDQKMVMAHELTHALQDQHFKIDNWVKAARPNDDAELARESVLEGSAMAAMVDYLLQGTGRSLQDLPDIDPSMLVGDMESTPMLKKAPTFLRDALIFPYLDGLNFSAAVIRPKGWDALSGVFVKPPVSTQQIMHPATYFSFRVPPKAELPSLDKDLGSDWVRLEDNLMGEFGWKEVLKQFLNEDRATPLSAAWSSDRYILFEQKKTKKLVLIARLDFADERATTRFFAAYSEVLAKKYDKRTNEKKQEDFLSFDTADGGVFFKCVQMSCVSLEGADRALFDKLNSGVHWDTGAPANSIDRASVQFRRKSTNQPPLVAKIPF
ncbi:MAG: hypothetical protein JO260_03085 [Acidobacteria bacterium]|nr:hypothetical protein [Acidobacteriota bacterium]